MMLVKVGRKLLRVMQRMLEQEVEKVPTGRRRAEWPGIQIRLSL